jgi:hypothetical protein
MPRRRWPCGVRILQRPWPEKRPGRQPHGRQRAGGRLDYFPGPVTQQVSGLILGQAYTLSFSYGAGQQVGFRGDNLVNYWDVSLGNSKQQTASLANVSQGFTGWHQASMTFTATNSSELLSFMAKGSLTGAPPFMLLDGVSLVSAVPEPSTWGMLIGGLGLIGFAARRRRADQTGCPWRVLRCALYF